MRRVVEEHEAGAHRIAKVEDVQACRRLVQSVAIATRIEAKQAAEQQAQRGLVRDHEHMLTGMVRDDLANHRQRARQHGDARLAAFRRKCERIFFPRRVLVGELLFDDGSDHAFPVAMMDFAQAVTLFDRQLQRTANDASGLERARERTAVNGGDPFVPQPLAKLCRLPPAIV